MSYRFVGSFVALPPSSYYELPFDIEGEVGMKRSSEISGQVRWTGPSQEGGNGPCPYPANSNVWNWHRREAASSSFVCNPCWRLLYQRQGPWGGAGAL